MLKQQIQRVEPNRKMNEVLLLQNNARPHIRLRTKEATTKTEWTVLPHPTYSPDLAPCNFHLLGPLKVSLQKWCFADSNELEHSMCEELRCFSKEFYVTSIQHLMQRWKKCIDNKGDLVEKQSQLHTEYTHDIGKSHYNCNYSFCEKTGGFTFIPPLVCYATAGQSTHLLLNFLQ